ncbi:MAG: DUF6061 family protein [Faecousia sp.]
MRKAISCKFNIDTARVEVKYADGSVFSIDCTLVKAEVARNMYESSELPLDAFAFAVSENFWADTQGDVFNQVL